MYFWPSGLLVPCQTAEVHQHRAAVLGLWILKALLTPIFWQRAAKYMSWFSLIFFSWCRWRFGISLQTSGQLLSPRLPCWLINVPDRRARRGRSCVWHGALGASSAPSAQPSAPRGPALEVSRFYSVTLGLSFAIFLHTSRFCVFPGEKGKSFFKLCRHRLAVGKHGECRREGTCCLDY